MADINSITSAAGYTGSPALGGGLGVGVTLDPAPLQRLANFIYYRDRDVWEQKQKDDKIAADKIAAIAAFDISSPFKQYSQDLQGSLDRIHNFIRENPNSLVYSRDPEAFQKREQLQAEFLNKRRRATSNDALYNAELAKINQIVDNDERAIAKRELDLNTNDLFAAGVETAYDKQLSSTRGIKPSDYKIPMAASVTTSFITPLPNEIGKTEITFTDWDDVKTKAALTVASATTEDITKTDAFKRMSPERQQLELDKAGITGKTRKMLQDIATSFTKYLEAWQKANPKIDVSKLTAATVGTLPDGIIEDNIRSAILINDQIDELNKYVLEGRVKDPLGRVRTKLYEKINFADGLSEVELVAMRTIQESKNAIIQKIDKTVISTNDANEKERLRIEAKNAETSRIIANKKPEGGATLETTGVIDLTGYTGNTSALSIADMAAINPSWVTEEGSVVKLTQEGEDARDGIKILPNGDVTYTEVKPKRVNGKRVGDVTTVRTVPKSIYQRNAVTLVQTTLKDRKGETGNPFTNTGKSAAKVDKNGVPIP